MKIEKVEFGLVDKKDPYNQYIYINGVPVGNPIKTRGKCKKCAKIVATHVQEWLEFNKEYINDFFNEVQTDDIVGFD